MQHLSKHHPIRVANARLSQATCLTVAYALLVCFRLPLYAQNLGRDSVRVTNPRIQAQTLEINLDTVASSDIRITEGGLAYRVQLKRTEWGLNLNHSYMDLGYQPNSIADLIGKRTSRTENRIGTQIYANTPLGSRHTIRLGGGFYDGFTNFRTVWLDEYYHQQFSELTGYQTANPYGINGLLGWRWEYRPASGIAELNLSYQKDVISPGYDRPLFQPLERGRDRLRTGGITFTAEQVLSPRIRARMQLSLTDTTNRSLRHAAQLSLNYSLADHWVLRTSLARTGERTGFRSHSLEASLEHDWQNQWFLGMGGRYYQDNGDIENSLFVVSTAAPDLEAKQLFVSLRWTNHRSAFRIEAGPYLIDYTAPDSIVAPFANLYRERNFFRAGISYSYSF